MLAEESIFPKLKLHGTYLLKGVIWGVSHLKGFGTLCTTQNTMLADLH